MVVGDKKPFVTKDRVKSSDTTVTIQYFEIEAVHDKIILKRTLDEILKEG